jgi:class 3 adenylate cyclase
MCGYSKLAGSDEEQTLARLRALRSDLIDPTIAVHHGRVVKRTGDGSIIESSPTLALQLHLAEGLALLWPNR